MKTLIPIFKWLLDWVRSLFSINFTFEKGLVPESRMRLTLSLTHFISDPHLPFFLERARQIMRTKSLSENKDGCAHGTFLIMKKLNTMHWISIFICLFVNRLSYSVKPVLFSKTTDLCCEISYVSIDNSRY